MTETEFKLSYGSAYRAAYNLHFKYRNAKSDTEWAELDNEMKEHYKNADSFTLSLLTVIMKEIYRKGE